MHYSLPGEHSKRSAGTMFVKPEDLEDFTKEN